MSQDPATPDPVKAARAYVRRSRREQGLPEHVEDRCQLAIIAAALIADPNRCAGEVAS